jgi:hypothetical protein
MFTRGFSKLASNGNMLWNGGLSELSEVLRTVARNGNLPATGKFAITEVFTYSRKQPANWKAIQFRLDLSLGKTNSIPTRVHADAAISSSSAFDLCSRSAKRSQPRSYVCILLKLDSIHVRAIKNCIYFHSSSAMVTLALRGEPIMYSALADRITRTLSLPSVTLSSSGATIRCFEAAPAGIVTFFASFL